LGAGPDVCGPVEVVDIGLAGGVPELLLVEDGDAIRPARRRTAHKWSAGSVLVMGGSPGMVGAAVFSARAALAFGAGAVGVASPSASTVQVLAPEVLAYDPGVIPARYAVIVVGPGMGEDRAALEAATSSGLPLVVDADALGLLQPDVTFEQPVVLTPHAGEFRRITGEEPGPTAAGELARRTGAVVLLKGNPTFVTDGAVPRVVTSGGPELATIGTGDVLAGMIGALLARGLPALEAATSAAHWHGVAARELAAEGTVTADRLAGSIRRQAWSAS
jgi:NAD(P)H-hydrate epimerase